MRQNYYLEKPGHLKYKNSNSKASLLKRKTIASSSFVLNLWSVNWQEMKQAFIIVLRVFFFFKLWSHLLTPRLHSRHDVSAKKSDSTDIYTLN